MLPISKPRPSAQSPIWPVLTTLFAILAILSSLTHHPHEIDPDTRFSAAPSPYHGIWAANAPGNGNLTADNTLMMAENHIHFAETLFLHPNSPSCHRVYATDNRGRIWKLESATAKDQSPQIVAHVGGTLLGAAFDKHGGIYVADATRGLFYLAPRDDGFDTPRLVAARAPSSLGSAVADDSLDRSEIRYCNDVAVDTHTGHVYFTDSTKIAPSVSTERRGDTFRSYTTSHITSDATGRLLMYDPHHDTTHVLVTGIPFANGVGVSPDGERVYFASTSSYTVKYVHTLGEEYFDPPAIHHFDEIDHFFNGGTLPGMIDGLGVDERGNVFVPVFGPLPPIARMADKAPAWLRRLLVMLPNWVRPKKSSVYTMIVELSSDGQLKRVLHDKERKFGLLTSVAPCGDYVFCGALKGHFGVRIDRTAN